jgi:hypothetical protein
MPDDFSTVIVRLTLCGEAAVVEERWMTRCMGGLAGRELVSYVVRVDVRVDSLVDAILPPLQTSSRNSRERRSLKAYSQVLVLIRFRVLTIASLSAA